MAKHLGILVLSLLGFLVSPVAVGAQQSVTLYVSSTDPTCAGHSPCFATIQAAINAAGPGNVVQIQAGSYPEQLAITGKNNFPGATEVDRIVIEADPITQPGQVVLTGARRRRSGERSRPMSTTQRTNWCVLFRSAVRQIIATTDWEDESRKK